jgi:hypothetical protein
MRKDLFLISFVLIFGVLFLGLVSDAHADKVSRFDAATIFLDKICLEPDPPVDSYAPGDQFAVMNAILEQSRGITALKGKDPDGAITVGEFMQVYNTLVEGKDVKFDRERAQCPSTLAGLSALDPGTEMDPSDFVDGISCFPYCEGTEIFAYEAPEGLTPIGASPEGEDRASQSERFF